MGSFTNLSVFNPENVIVTEVLGSIFLLELMPASARSVSLIHNDFTIFISNLPDPQIGHVG